MLPPLLPKRLLVAAWRPLFSTSQTHFHVVFKDVSAPLRLTARPSEHDRNYHELSVHMSALERMVRMRGGLQQLGWDGILQMFISWWVAPRNETWILDND